MSDDTKCPDCDGKGCHWCYWTGRREERHAPRCSAKVKKRGSFVTYDVPCQTLARYRVEWHPTRRPRFRACPQHVAKVVDEAAKLRWDDMVRVLPLDSDYQWEES